jgi:hypothetical protein
MNPNAPALVEFTIGGTAVTSYNPGTGNSDAFNIPLFAALDGSGNTYNIYIPQYGANNLLKVTQSLFGNGTTLANQQYYDFFGGFDFNGNNAYSTTTPCLDKAASAVFDATGTLYTYGETYGDVCSIDTTTGAADSTKTGFTTTTIGGPSVYSVDHSNKLWGANAANNTLLSYKSGGAITTYTGGGLNQPCSTAVDGAGNIWVGNAGTYGVSEFTGAGVAMSPIKGSATLALGGYSPQLDATYTVGGTTVFNPAGVASYCASPAIDRAGNVWVVYQGTASTLAPGVVFEILGAAAPTVTPVSYATFGNGTTGYLGTRP